MLKNLICPLLVKNDRSIASLMISITNLYDLITPIAQMMQHCKHQNIPNNRQHAFRKHNSCETQLVSVIHNWATSTHNWKQAFDMVHDENLKKCELCRNGVRFIHMLSEIGFV